MIAVWSGNRPCAVQQPIRLSGVLRPGNERRSRMRDVGTEAGARSFRADGAARPGDFMRGADLQDGSDQRHVERWQPGRRGSPTSRRWLVPALVGTAAALGAAALYNRKQARDAERRYPPIGRFLD